MWYGEEFLAHFLRALLSLANGPKLQACIGVNFRPTLSGQKWGLEFDFRTDGTSPPARCVLKTLAHTFTLPDDTDRVRSKRGNSY